MAHTYVLTSVNLVNDQVTVTGTVDGTSTVVSFWITPASTAAMASAIGFRNFVAPLMLASLPVAPIAQPTLVGTFSQ